jgi:hypothetical protein
VEAHVAHADEPRLRASEHVARGEGELERSAHEKPAKDASLHKHMTNLAAKQRTLVLRCCGWQVSALDMRVSCTSTALLATRASDGRSI